jgi:hypothetical protein
MSKPPPPFVPLTCYGYISQSLNIHVQVVCLRYSDNQSGRLAMAFRIRPNVVWRSRLDLGIVVRI